KSHRQPFTFSIFAEIAKVLRPRAVTRAHRFSFQSEGSAFRRIKPKDRAHQLCSAGTHQTGDAQNLAASQLKTRLLQNGRRGQILDLEHRVSILWVSGGSRREKIL